MKLRRVAQLGRALRSGRCAREAFYSIIFFNHRGVAQLVERVVRDDEAACSNQVTPIFLCQILTFF